MSRRAPWLALFLGWMMHAVTASAEARSPCEEAEAHRVRPYLHHVRARAVPRSPEDVQRIWSLAEVVVLPHDPALVEHDLFVLPETLARLQAAGIDARELPERPQDIVDRSYGCAPPPRVAPDRAGIFDDWFDVTDASSPAIDAIEARMQKEIDASGGHGAARVIGKSVRGRDIRAVRFATSPDDGDRASIVVTSTHHAREWLTPMAAMGVVHGLASQYDVDTKVKAVLDNLVVYVVPVLNVDGYVLTKSGERLRRTNQSASCASGVDLNRNYDVHFGQNLPQSCGGESYPGRAAFSEPEPAAIKALVAGLKKPRWYIDYHTNFNSIALPYAFTNSTSFPWYAHTRGWGDAYVAAMKQVHGNAMPVNQAWRFAQDQGGIALDWFRDKYSDSFAVELRGGSNFEIPQEGALPSVEEHWVAWLTIAAEVAKENPVSGGVPDGGGAGGSGPDGGRRDAGGNDAQGGAAGSGRAGAGGVAAGGAGPDGAAGSSAGGSGAGGDGGSTAGRGGTSAGGGGASAGSGGAPGGAGSGRGGAGQGGAGGGEPEYVATSCDCATPRGGMGAGGAAWMALGLAAALARKRAARRARR